VPDSPLRLAADPAAVPVRDAATVVLLRDGPAGLEAFLLQRAPAMAFAAGMTVFPGGVVDEQDAEVDLGWVGPPAADWAGSLAAAPPLARALVCAAVRETFEECGVLLAGPGRADAELLGEGRADLVAHRRTLGQLLTGAGLVLHSELLRPWSRWITPPASPRRYDTAFLVAVVPAGQDADAHTTEAVEAAWWYPDEALAEWQRGGMQLMAPTYRTLQQIGEHPTSAALFAAAEHRVISPVRPRSRREGDDLVLEVDEGHLLPMDGERTLLSRRDS
jgi:8-oxo-dGTP pyrophosphatase MutT (NUDIX family)